MPNSTTNPPVEITSRPVNIATWQPTAASSTGSGNNTTLVAGTLYYASLWVPGNVLINNVNVLIGGTGGTDKWQAAIFDIGGKLLASSALAGATVGTASTIQSLAITLVGENTTANPLVASSGLQVVGPRHLLVGIISNGTTATLCTIPAYTGNGYAGSTATGEAFGAPADFACPGTFTANTGPVAYLS